MKVVEEVELAATPEVVWQVIGDFHAMAAWHPGVVESRAESGGKVRRLVVPDGAEVVEEQLDCVDAMACRYTILDSPMPLLRHEGLLRVEANGAGSRVVWSCDFDAPEDALDAVAQGMSFVFRSGLASLKATLAG
ncbi:SRPBCC family protein [Polymorphum gilvum]|uniref:MxaD protein n=1 Tax=Polymorphum gilvum (strain LMG 25793 / CGMCC 1.9160 / SL003B-26A1) TaxID=991905 RepID=F2IXH2_POLGS|nr:SRPBCC family protein [Polymorphum gilvum]ADZ71594.1 MxaD protein [Polymorphum gilvum SL003B-26A1]